MLGSTIEQFVDAFIEQYPNKEESKQKISYDRLLGMYIGTVKGIISNDIPEDLKSKLQVTLKELEQIELW